MSSRRTVYLTVNKEKAKRTIMTRVGGSLSPYEQGHNVIKIGTTRKGDASDNWRISLYDEKLEKAEETVRGTKMEYLYLSSTQYGKKPNYGEKAKEALSEYVETE